MQRNPSGTVAVGSVVFYGWWNVLACFVGLALSYAMFTVFAFGTFVGPLQAEFGWGRAEMSVALTFTNITVVFCSPAIGLLVDRLGVRRVLLPSVLLMALSVAAMSRLQGSIWQLYALYVLIPLLGAGTLPLTYSRVVIAWFRRRRGIALGISLAGFGIGASLIPPLGQFMIANYGWRAAYLGFAAAIVLLSFPLAALLLRESPARMGLAADGADPLQPEIADEPHGLGALEAARTRSYWLVFASFLLVGVGVGSVLGHLVPMLTDRGMERATASMIMGALGMGLVVGRVLSGYLMDRFFAPFVAAVFLLGMCAGIALLAMGVSGTLALFAAVLVGLATGSEISEIAYIVSRYFGQTAFGGIYGVMFGAFQIGSALGAPAVGYYYDAVGDYSGALWAVSVLVSVAALLIVSLQRYPDLATERPR